MPTPCPQPRPVRTAAACEVATLNHPEGTVTGSGGPCRLGGGYLRGRKHGAHSLTSSRNADSSSVRLVSSPWITTVEPWRASPDIVFPFGQRSAARRNVVRSRNGSVTRQRDSGEAPSSCSATGR